MKIIINNFGNYKEIINSYDNKENHNYISPISLSLEDVLKTYNIINIEDLEAFIKQNLDNINFLTIKRLFNCWVIVNFKILKKYIDYLVFIFLYIFNYYKNKVIITDYDLLKNDKLKKMLKIDIKNWINKQKKDNFNFNIWDDIKIKYEEVLKHN